MNSIKNLIVCLLFALPLIGCTLEIDPGPTTLEPSGYYVEYETSYESDGYYYDDYYGYCEEPYWHGADWCDYYDDGSICCVWYVDGWYEEWCQWDYDWCWEYNGSF